MKPSIDWSSEEVMAILTDPHLNLSQMAERLDRSYWKVSRMRKKLGLKRVFISSTARGLGRRLTNTEAKRRYNAKIKAVGYKPLYTLANNNPSTEKTNG